MILFLFFVVGMERVRRRPPTASARARRGQDHHAADPPPRKRGRTDAGPSVPPPPRSPSPPSSATSSSDSHRDRTRSPSPATASTVPGIDLDRPLTTAFPGGPSDPSLLPSFTSHVAAHIWYGSERDPLRCISHGSKIADWPWWTREAACS